MKNNAVLCNSGHFDCEVDVAALRSMASETFSRRQGIEGFRLPDGRTLVKQSPNPCGEEVSA